MKGFPRSERKGLFSEGKKCLVNEGIPESSFSSFPHQFLVPFLTFPIFSLKTKKKNIILSENGKNF